MPHPPAQAARRSTWRSRSPRRVTHRSCVSSSTSRCPWGSTSSRRSRPAPRSRRPLTASVWELRLDGVAPEDAERAVDAFKSATRWKSNAGPRTGCATFDARGAVASLEAHSPQADRPTDQPCAILRLVVRHVTPAVRPDDVLSGLRAVADLAPPVAAAVTRLAQGLFDEETGTGDRPVRPTARQSWPPQPIAQGPPKLPPRRRRAKEGPGVRTDVVAPPSDPGATWVGQRTDQKTFARPYAHMAYGTGETGHRELPCGARAPDGGTAHRASRGRHRHCRTRRGAREPDGRSTRMLQPTEPTEGS